MSLKNFTDEAIVLKRTNLGEADRILTVFTRGHGKLAAIAKGVRKTSSKKAPHIEPLTHTKLYFVKTKSLPIITQAETITSFDYITQNLDVARLAFHVGELIDKLIPEEQEHPETYKDLLTMLNYLNQSQQDILKKQQIAVTRFQLKLLDNLGFGAPVGTDYQSTIDFIEKLLDRRLSAADSLS